MTCAVPDFVSLAIQCPIKFPDGMTVVRISDGELKDARIVGHFDPSFQLGSTDSSYLRVQSKMGHVQMSGILVMVPRDGLARLRAHGIRPDGQPFSFPININPQIIKDLKSTAASLKTDYKLQIEWDFKTKAPVGKVLKLIGQENNTIQAAVRKNLKLVSSNVSAPAALGPESLSSIELNGLSKEELSNRLLKAVVELEKLAKGGGETPVEPEWDRVVKCHQKICAYIQEMERRGFNTSDIHHNL